MLLRLNGCTLDGYQSLGKWTITTDIYQSVLPSWRSHSGTFTQEINMKLIHDLFTTDYGIMSISGIVFMLGMGVFFYRFFTNKMNEPVSKTDK